MLILRDPPVRALVALLGLLLMLTMSGPAAALEWRSLRHEPPAPAAPDSGSCDIVAASPWIWKWFAAWEFTSQNILRLPAAPPPEIVFFDSSCVYTTSAVAAGGAPPEDGPTLLGDKLPWRALAHRDTLLLPDSSRVPVALLSFTRTAQRTGPYFVMAAPSYWAQKTHGLESGFTGVFLHEFAHTRQVGGFKGALGPIDSTWAYPEELDDDAVQTHFGSDSTYVAAYRSERDLLYRAADTESLTAVRALAESALAMIRNRHARWFTGDRTRFATLDDIFLSLEGAGQWTAYAWLAHPQGGGLDRQAAIQRMLGRRRWWVQDEGLGLFLVVDRLLPDWPSLVFHQPSLGASELLERAVRNRE